MEEHPERRSQHQLVAAAFFAVAHASVPFESDPTLHQRRSQQAVAAAVAC